MGKILEAFLNEQINLDVRERTAEHKKLCKEGSELQERLEEKLNDEEKELLNRLVNVIFDEGTCYAQNKFVRGYQLGVLSTMEIFFEQDTFLNGEV